MKHGIIAVLVCLSSLTLCAQPAPQFEVFGGGGYFKADTSPDLAQFGTANINTYGWQVSASEYLNRWFGATLSVNGNYGRPTITVPANVLAPGIPASNLTLANVANLSTYSAMFGPSVAYRKSGALQPFAHALLGVVHGRLSTTSKGTALICGTTGICPTILLNGSTVQLQGTSLHVSDTVFGYALGGGVDVKVTKLLAVRTQADFVRSQFNDLGDDRQNNFNVSGGLVFRFGSR